MLPHSEENVKGRVNFLFSLLFLETFLKKGLTIRTGYDIISFVESQICWCGSMAEQLICNQQVDGSTPFTSSKRASASALSYGGIPEWPKGADCKSVVTDFDGPNPSSPTKKYREQSSRYFFIQAAGLAYHPPQGGTSSRAARRPCISSRASVYFPCGLMIYNTSC